MARNVRPASAVSDHGGSVKFAGAGLIPACRVPLPSPLTPWQMTQLVVKVTPPACCALRDANIPAGAVGALRSHPEMTSEIVNRAVAARNLWFVNHLEAKIFYFADNG